MSGNRSNKGWVERDSTWEGMEGIDREWMEVNQKKDHRYSAMEPNEWIRG